MTDPSMDPTRIDLRVPQPTTTSDGATPDRNDRQRADFPAVRRFFFLLLLGDGIRRLTTLQQDILDMVVWGRMTMTEVANRLGMPRPTVYDHYNAAIHELRRLAKNDPTLKLTFDMLRDLID